MIILVKNFGDLNEKNQFTNWNYFLSLNAYANCDNLSNVMAWQYDFNGKKMLHKLGTGTLVICSDMEGTFQSFSNKKIKFGFGICLENCEKDYKPNTVYVNLNTSRSSLIVTKDLIAALRLGRPGMAALDVFDVEPLPKDSELHQLPNLLMTPHLGFVSQPVFEQFSKGIHEVLFTWIEDRGILNQVTL